MYKAALGTVHFDKHGASVCFYTCAWRDCTCEILARYHAPGAGWYWNPHTAAINIPIYFLTYIFSYYFKKHISKYSLKTVGNVKQQRC